MSEYIKKDNAVEGIHNGLWNGTICGPSGVEEFLISMPTEDVVPVVRGKWKYYHKQGIAVCTHCSFERKLDDNFGKAIACPNCGARME